MSFSETGLERRLRAASDLRIVVRTLKKLAVASLRPLESAVLSLKVYSEALELGLACAVRELVSAPMCSPPAPEGLSLVLAFGSDLGMVGPFNESLAAFLRSHLESFGARVRIWAVGDRLRDALAPSGPLPDRVLSLPGSLATIVSLVDRIILDLEKAREAQGVAALYLVNHRGGEGGTWETNARRMLPLDQLWLNTVLTLPWPTRRIPQAVPGGEALFTVLIREYLFASLFRACAESLAYENLSRMAAMERAEKNIDTLAEGLIRERKRRVQEDVSQELLEILTAYDALNPPAHQSPSTLVSYALSSAS